MLLTNGIKTLVFRDSSLSHDAKSDRHNEMAAWHTYQGSIIDISAN